MTVRQLIKYAGYELQLEIVAGHEGLDREIKTAESDRPGLALCGHYEHFGSERVQILGHGEVSYLEGLSRSVRCDILEELFSHPLPCVVITNGLSIPPELIAVSDRKNTPIFDNSAVVRCYYDATVAIPRG